MAQHAQLLVDLIRYVRGLQPGATQASHIPVSDLLVDQDMARTLQGVELTPSADVWLRVHKLPEDPAPEPDPGIAGLLSGALDDPQRPPAARASEPLDDDTVLALEAAQQWIEGEWSAWASKTAPVHRSNAFYQDLFHTMTRLKLEGGAEAREVVCGMGMGGWDIPGMGPVELPLLMQSCEVVMSGQGDGALEIRPAASAPELALGVFSRGNPGSLGLAKAWLNEGKWQDGEYTPGDRSSWEGLLEGLATRLDPGASVVERSTPGKHLQVDSRWCFYLRDRPGDRIRRDLDALEEVLLKSSEPGDIPVFLKAMVDKDIHCEQEQGQAIAWRGSEQIGTVAPGMQAQDLLFPLPYNDEQAQIISHLASGCGAIVQGPPGTGKSHTIANVICHYLALGKRVLVAASSADALDVVRDKIPAQVRDLVAALLSSDAISLADFERSIMEIEHRLANLDPSREQARAGQLQALVDQTHEKTKAIDDLLDAHAAKHRGWIEVAGARMSMAHVARSWREGLDDGIQALPGPVPPVLDPGMDETVVLARAQRSALGQMINDAHVLGGLPQSLPGRDEVEQMVRARKELDGAEHRVAMGEVWAVAIDDANMVDQAEQALVGIGEQIGRLNTEQEQFLAGAGGNWQAALTRVVEFAAEDPIVFRLRDIGQQAQETMLRLRQTDGRVDTHGWMNRGEHIDHAREALVRLAQGEPAFAWWQAPARSQARAVLAQVKIDGAEPSNAQQWETVRERVEAQLLARTLYTQWNGIAAEVGLEQVGDRGSISAVMGSLAQAWLACDRARRMRGLEMEVNRYIATLFVEPRTKMMDINQRIGKAVASIRASRQSRQMRTTLAAWDGSMQQLAQTGSFGAQAVEGASVSGAGAVEYWAGVGAQLQEVRRVAKIRKDLVESVEQANAMGFGAWARQWLEPDGQIDEDWKRRWRWQEMDRTMEGLGRGDEIPALLEQRRGLVRQLNDAIGALVAVRAWMGAANSANAQVRRALKDYAGAVRKQGGGQGKRAARHRASAREAMKQAYAAVPCWIMPHGRVCESLPPELGLFDLVIIDEASQSDIQALPTLLRGKQLLIVGDDRQVSPAAVGVSEERVAQWMASDLARQPYAHLMLPERSLYDLFNVVFSGRDVMLREHFRSVEPIIAYSNQHYYHDMIVPLRAPKANERIDPPLVDVLVRDGIYHNGVNLGEAKWIADEIERILADPQFEGKSIGVVTLTSNDKQAIAIHDELGMREIDMDTWVRRGLAVGPPPRFQGKERDIMFVSMVWDGRNRREGASNSQSFRQAFNVAMSRARDRLYLVRSNDGRAFRPDSILSHVVSHMQPSSHPPVHARNASGDSFPDRLAREAMGRGFAVSDADLPHGVDLVLEDPASGARLAVSCDGHMTPGMGASWADAMRRQRVLERAGWTVWRGFESHFIADPEAFMDRLQAAANAAGIQATGGTQAQGLAVVERRTVGEPVDVQVPADEAVEEDNEGWPADPAHWPQEREAMMGMCDSPFEREVLEALLARRFRVQPQYPCAGYRIDLVVQGPDGARMAIECDGDSHHGLDKLEADRARQAWLEQAENLPFWRCWYSDWQSDRVGSMTRLWEALDRAGVRPWA